MLFLYCRHFDEIVTKAVNQIPCFLETVAESVTGAENCGDGTETYIPAYYRERPDKMKEDGYTLTGIFDGERAHNLLLAPPADEVAEQVNARIVEAQRKRNLPLG